MVTAQKNLSVQNGFKSIEEGVRQLKKSNAKMLQSLINATLLLVPSIVQLAADPSVLKKVSDALDDMVIGTEVKDTRELIRHMNEIAQFQA